MCINVKKNRAISNILLYLWPHINVKNKKEMKKLLLTAVVAFSTLFASAQIMLLTTYDGDLEGASQITGNIGVAFQASDQITAGLQRETMMAAGTTISLDENGNELIGPGADGQMGDVNSTDPAIVAQTLDNDTTFDMVEESTYNIFVRYTVKDDIYAIFQMPTKDGSDLARVGLGYSFQVMSNLYFEPSYTMLMKADKSDGTESGDRMAKFNMGISYKL